MQEWVAKNRAKGTANTEAVWYPGNEDYLWVKANYALDGKVKGEKLKEAYWDFREGSSERAEKQAQKLYDELAKDLGGGSPTYLDKESFLLLIEDEIASTEQEHAEATEGYWIFTYRERNYEIFNYGDRVVLSYTKKMPDEWSEATQINLVEQMQKWVSKKEAKHATSTEAQTYPGYANYLWVTATYAIDGSLEGKKIHEGYWHFCDDYAEKLDKEVTKALQK